MNKIILFCILTSQVAGAAEIHPFPKPQTAKALELMQEYLEAPGHARAKLSIRLQKLELGGPVFVDEALKLIAANREKWKGDNEPRSAMLTLVNNAIRKAWPWTDFAGSSLKNSIHASAQSLLQILANTGSYQKDLLEVYNRLDLWDPTDLRFLIRKSYSGGTGTRYFPRLIENFKEASLEDRQYLLQRTRKQNRRELVQYALAYRTGLMEPEDYTWLLRLFMDDGRQFRKLSYVHDPLTFGIRRMPEPLGHLTEDEIYARNNKAIEGLLGEVMLDIHTRLLAKDPLIKGAYDELRENSGWPGLRLSEEEKAAHLEFLRGLYTGSVLDGCAKALSSIDTKGSDK